MSLLTLIDHFLPAVTCALFVSLFLIPKAQKLNQLDGRLQLQMSHAHLPLCFLLVGSLTFRLSTRIDRLERQVQTLESWKTVAEFREKHLRKERPQSLEREGHDRP